MAQPLGADGATKGRGSRVWRRRAAAVTCGRRRIRLWNPELNLEKTESVNLRAGEQFKKSSSWTTPSRAPPPQACCASPTASGRSGAA